MTTSNIPSFDADIAWTRPRAGRVRIGKNVYLTILAALTLVLAALTYIYL